MRYHEVIMNIFLNFEADNSFSQILKQRTEGFCFYAKTLLLEHEHCNKFILFILFDVDSMHFVTNFLYYIRNFICANKSTN